MNAVTSKCQRCRKLIRHFSGRKFAVSLIDFKVADDVLENLVPNEKLVREFDFF